MVKFGGKILRFCGGQGCGVLRGGAFRALRGSGGVGASKGAHAKKECAQKAGRIAYQDEQSAFDISVFPSMVLE
ncbi:hypothetical protein [Bartonella mastomydis]|uniref:hypothetical protein n=1 Tax=Bartonella mastomydis TaxID=1820002 RepID=UPI0015D5DDE5|nr:hypothetical protein [Bartonella mastomydis]